MRFFKRTLTALAIVAVFGVSFVMGHISAVKSVERRGEDIKEEAERAVAVLPLLRASEPASPDPLFEDDEPDTPVIHTAAPGEEVEVEEEAAPFPLPVPVSGNISAQYSLQAVYSATMGDWRAHTGMDVEAPLTTAVIAAADGTITKAYEDKLWGSVIEIQHSGGLKTVYKGLSTLSMVRVGQQVKEGDVISGVGTAPIESKAMPHLHFETWQDGVCVNPESYVVE